MSKALEFCRKHSDKLVLAVLLVIILQGTYLRFTGLDSQSLWLDEAFSAQRAKAILEHGYPLLDNGRVSKSYIPVHYLMSLGLLVFDEMHFALRFFPALAGVLLIPVFFLFNRRITGSSIQALIAAGVIAFMTYEIAWSRQARMYMILQSAGIAALWAFTAFIQDRKLKYLCLSVLFILITIFSHPSGYLFALVCLLAAAPEVRNYKEWREWVMSSVKHKAVCGVLAAGAIGAFIAACIAGIDIFTITQAVASSETFSYGKIYYRFLRAEFGNVLWVSLFGMAAVCWKYRRFGIPVATVTVMFFCYIAFHSFLFHQRYVMPIIPFMVAFAVMGPWSIISSTWDKRDVRGRGAAVCIAVLCYVPLFFMQSNLKPYKGYLLGVTAPQPNWRAAYRYIEEDAARMGAESIRTVSAYPMFHDLYLGNRGEKYYLPITLTGRKQDVLMQPSASSAKAINDPMELGPIRGYIVLDEMAFSMLFHDDMKKILKAVKPDRIIPGMNNMFKIFIWHIPPRNKQGL